MDVAIAVTGEHPEDELPSLRSWLAGDDDLAGLVDPTGSVDTGPADTVTPVDTIAVCLDPPGAATALADSLVAWIRDHNHDVVYEVRRPDNMSVRVSARRVRATGGAVVRDLIAELCRSADADTDTDVSSGTDICSDGDIDTARAATAPGGPR
ncbi:MAG TPA: hypothetical protein VIS06_11800 [Mycobacteriales bacterium]